VFGSAFRGVLGQMLAFEMLKAQSKWRLALGFQHFGNASLPLLFIR